MYPSGHLHNIKTGCYHPIVFYCHPRPSDNEDTDELVRYKSSGHHTEGFDTLELSKDFIASQPDWQETNLVWKWDGEEAPAMTCDFPPPKKLPFKSPT